jgi:hypothetical protein
MYACLLKSIFSHKPGEVSGILFFHPDGENLLSRAPGFSILPGFGPSSIRRAQAIPSLPGSARGLWTKQKRAKRRRYFPRVVWPRRVGERDRSSSSSSRLPRIVVFPAHRLPRAVKTAADGRPATWRGELMHGRLYIAAYRASGRPHSPTSPQIHCPPPPPLPGDQWRTMAPPTKTARRTMASAGVPSTSGRDVYCTRRATRRRPTSARPEVGV